MTVRLEVVKPLPTPGRWMAERLGIVRRFRHFVPAGNELIKGPNGWPIGYISACNQLAIPDREHLDRLPLCPTCLAKQKNRGGA